MVSDLKPNVEPIAEVLVFLLSFHNAVTMAQKIDTRFFSG